VAKLIVMAGLPASGKSSIARELARRTGAVWLRVDSMDQAI
jgi:predicted kinase